MFDKESGQSQIIKQYIIQLSGRYAPYFSAYQQTAIGLPCPYRQYFHSFYTLTTDWTAQTAVSFSS